VIAHVQNRRLEAMAVEDGLDADAIKDTNPASRLTGAAAPGAVAVPKEPVQVTLTETVSASIKQDGSLGSYVCNGEVQITCRVDDIKCAINFDRDDSLQQVCFYLFIFPCVTINRKTAKS